MRKKIGSALIITLIGMCSIAWAGYLEIDSATSFSNVVAFGSFGTGEVSWDDGNTMLGVYIANSGLTPYINPLATSTGGNGTSTFYNLGLSGDSDRALGMLPGNATGHFHIGFQYKNLTGQDSLCFNYNVVIEQWGVRNTAQQTITLAYKITTAGDTNNLLDSADWVTAGTALTPLTGGTLPYERDGNTNQFTISGSIINLAINDDEYVTFRVTKNNDSGGDALVGVDSFTLETIPAPPASIQIDSTSFSEVTTFDSFGTGDVSWNDGNTVQGVYITNSGSTAYLNPLPDNIGSGGTSTFYNLGLSGDSDRALGMLPGNATGHFYIGFQYRNLTGEDSLNLNYDMILEQWGVRNSVQQEITLAYKISSGGDVNNLISPGWTTLGTALTPLADGTLPYERNGNTNQFAISGSMNIAINNGQYVTFRVAKLNNSGGDAMVAVDSFTLESFFKPDPASVSIAASSGSPSLSVGNLSNMFGVTNLLQAKTDLASGSWSNLYSFSGVTETNLTLPTDLPQGFFRIQTTY